MVKHDGSPLCPLRSSVPLCKTPQAGLRLKTANYFVSESTPKAGSSMVNELIRSTRLQNSEAYYEDPLRPFATPLCLCVKTASVYF